MKIKELNKKTVGEIIRIHEKAIYPLWDKLKRKYSDKSVRNFVLKTFEKGEVYGYFYRDKLVGCVGIIKEEENLEIGFILVLPESQGKGIGKELMDFIEGKTRGNCEKIMLEVLSKNPAVDFYRKVGFKIISKKKEKYVMEKAI